MTRIPLPDRPLAAILAAYVVLALVYLWATPPLEASDELWHVGMADAMADTGALPVQQVGVETQWEQEGSQPPLYYLIGAALIRSIDRDDFDILRQANPHAKPGIPGDSDNKNLVLHDTPHPAPQGTALAVYVLRLFGILLGGVTVAAVYAVTRLLAQNRAVAIVAAGLTAFNPMFLFIAASANNDNLIMALNSLVVWQMLLLLRSSFSARRSLWLALLLALASLSKLSALVLIPVVALAALYVAFRRRDWRGLVVLGVLVVGLWAIVAGWWYARNLTLYGELFGTATMAAIAGPRLMPFTAQTLLDEFDGFRIAYWGWFGAVSITTVPAYYVFMDALALLALVGLALHLWRIRRKNDDLIPPLLLGLVWLIGSVALVGWTAQTYASQGRLLFPYLAAISPLLALGLVAVFRRLALVAVGALGLFALVVPIVTIAPVYAPPPPLAALPVSAQPVYARYCGVELVGYETPDARYIPGDQVPITVYWQVVAQTDDDLSLYLHAVDSEGEAVGRIDSYPGAGRLRTTGWQPGAIYADFYRVPLERDLRGSYKLRVQAGWWNYETFEVCDATDASGQPLEAVMLDVGGLAGGEMPPDSLTNIDNVDFGGVIALDAYEMNADSVTLLWSATGTPGADYTVFVQVLDGEDQLVATGDAPPSLPTRYWRSGDAYVTQHPLTGELAPGTYRVLAGWYKPDDFTRLPAAFPDNAYPLGTLTVA